MAIPTWTVGEVLASADVNTWFVPLAAVKSSDQSISSSTVLTNDTALSIAVAANSTYAFTGLLIYEGGTQGSSDMKFQFTVPAGATLNYMPLHQSTAGNISGVALSTAASVPSCGSGGAGNSFTVTITGTLIVSSTSGTLQLQWAQNTSSGTATIMHQNSWLMLRRIT